MDSNSIKHMIWYKSDMGSTNNTQGYKQHNNNQYNVYQQYIINNIHHAGSG